MKLFITQVMILTQVIKLNLYFLLPTQVLNLLPICVGYALEEQFLLCTSYTGNKFNTWLIKK